MVSNRNLLDSRGPPFSGAKIAVSFREGTLPKLFLFWYYTFIYVYSHDFMIFSEQLGKPHSWAGKIHHFELMVHHVRHKWCITTLQIVHHARACTWGGVAPGSKASEESPNMTKTSQNNCNASQINIQITGMLASRFETINKLVVALACHFWALHKCLFAISGISYRFSLKYHSSK